MTATLYVRSRDGGTVHRMDGCTYSRPPFGIPWNWAEGKTVAALEAEARRYGLQYRWCRRCFPDLHREVAS
jgi:hypothetical protein